MNVFLFPRYIDLDNTFFACWPVLGATINHVELSMPLLQ
jgi:hypothetical protein